MARARRRARHARRTGVGADGRGERARGDGRLPHQLPAALPAVHRLGVVHVAQRRLAAGRPLQGRLDRPVRVHAAAVGRLRRHDRARGPRRPTTASTRWAGAARNRELARVGGATVARGAHRRRRSASSASCSACRSRWSATAATCSTMDHFVEREVFVEHPEGFVAPRLAVPDVGVAGAPGRGRARAGCRRRRRARSGAPGAAAAPRRRPGHAPARRRHRARPHRVLGRARRARTSSPRSAPTCSRSSRRPGPTACASPP